ncbi:MAG: hypothetical protein KAH44_11615, partial [Oricola sp.]|nr:hypothetical protein [Oricola sp.]
MSYPITFLVIAVLSLQAAFAAMPRYDDHLLPEASVYTDIRTLTGDKYSSVYADYEENVARVLIDAFNDSVVARVVVLPSFEPEY